MYTTVNVHMAIKTIKVMKALVNLGYIGKVIRNFFCGIQNAHRKLIIWLEIFTLMLEFENCENRFS